LRHRPHRVPRARQAIVILRELHRMTGQGEYVFPAVDPSGHRGALETF
jgi:integrase